MPNEDLDPEECLDCFMGEQPCAYHRGFQEGWDACAGLMAMTAAREPEPDPLVMVLERARRRRESMQQIPAHLLERAARRRMIMNARTAS